MRKTLATGLAIMAFSVPAASLADTTQLIALYQQLVAVLTQQLAVLQSQALSISPRTGTAPLTVMFTVNNSHGNEAIDFGDGHSTGSAGCVTNSAGFCDLSRPVVHDYQLPGSYKVSLYRTEGGAVRTVTTDEVIVK